MPRARRKVEHEIEFALGEPRYGIDVVKAPGGDALVRPDIFAHRQTDALSRKFKNRRLTRRLKVAIFVEHVVSRQQTFVRDVLHLAVPAEHRGIKREAAVAGFVRDHRAEHGRHIADAAREFVRARFDVGDEAFFEEQIARRVAAHRELREKHQLGAFGDERLISVEDTAAVSGEIADDGV